MENQGQESSLEKHVNHATSSLDEPAAKRLKLEEDGNQNGDPVTLEPQTKKREKVKGMALVKEE